MTRVEELIAAGYMQVSSKFRMIARLPEGKSGVEALREVDPAVVARWEKNLESQCRGYFLRCASKETVTLSIEEFAEFKKLGGEIA